jgi:hypothetical protein
MLVGSIAYSSVICPRSLDHVIGFLSLKAVWQGIGSMGRRAERYYRKIASIKTLEHFLRIEAQKEPPEQN